MLPNFVENVKYTKLTSILSWATKYDIFIRNEYYVSFTLFPAMLIADQIWFPEISYWSEAVGKLIFDNDYSCFSLLQPRDFRALRIEHQCPFSSSALR